MQTADIETAKCERYLAVLSERIATLPPGIELLNALKLEAALKDWRNSLEFRRHDLARSQSADSATPEK